MRIVQPRSKDARILSVKSYRENLSGRGDCDYHSKTLCNRSACISFDATCVERVSPNRAVNPTTGLVSRIGEGSALKHLSRVRDRRRVNEYVTRTLRHVLRLDLVTSISLYFHAKEIYKAMMHCYYTDACQSSHVFAEKN